MRALLFLYPSWDRTPLDMLGEPPVSMLRQRCFSPTFLIAYSAKGACCRKSTEDTRVHPGMYLMPKSAMNLSLVVFGWFLPMPQGHIVSMLFTSKQGQADRMTSLSA